jgi:hypothetical protein
MPPFSLFLSLSLSLSRSLSLSLSLSLSIYLSIYLSICLLISLLFSRPFLHVRAGISLDSRSFGPAQHQVNALVTNAPCSYVPSFIMRTYTAVITRVCVILRLREYSTRCALHIYTRTHASSLDLGQASRCRSTAFFIYLRHRRPNEISIEKVKSSRL